MVMFRNQSLINHTFLQSSIFKHQKSITAWEELVCLGYNPELSRIEAIVNIKRSTGYSGNLCSKGSPEYVRFFVDYNDGNGFQDLGLASFRAFNISDAPPGPQHPISYMIFKDVDDFQKKKLCNNEVIITLRAVLSWNSVPSTDPNDPPVYGNILEAEAVLKPFTPLLFPIDAPILAPISSPFEISSFQDQDAPKKIEIASFVKANLENGVSSGRIMSQVNAMMKTESPLDFGDFSNFDIAEFGFDPEELLKGLSQLDFNVNYEEIICVGLNTAQDTLGAVINLKRPTGYGGNLCQNGSLEYVSFFADFNNNGTFEKYLGTTHVRVNDIHSIPDEGLNYAVFLKTDLSKYLKRCNQPQVVRIRAVLSWATPPSTNPEQPTNWGNRMDVLVQLRPKNNLQTSIIYSIGNVAVEEISPSTCLAYPGNANRGNNRPWGGMITIKGGIDNSGAPGTTKYRVEYSKNGIDYFPVTLKQSISTIHFSTVTVHHHVLEDANGWFPYLANHDETNLIVIRNQVLATWPSHNFEGKYYVRVSFTKDDPIANPASIQHSTPIRIELDNTRFRVDNTANNSLDPQFDVDMEIDGGVCKVYDQNTIITGKVKVRDRYYGGYNLNIQPSTQVISHVGLINYAPGAITNNGNRFYFGPTSEAFNVDTSKLQKCGYTLRLRGFERTILNNNHNFPYVDKYVGFSVK